MVTIRVSSANLLEEEHPCTSVSHPRLVAWPV
jgi:hypothetical protein